LYKLNYIILYFITYLLTVELALYHIARGPPHSGLHYALQSVILSCSGV